MTAAVETYELIVYFANCKACDWEDEPRIVRLDAIHDMDLHNSTFHAGVSAAPSIPRDG